MRNIGLTPFFTVVLLIISNVFMTFAWYGHLKDKNLSLIAAIFLGWGIALFEYFFMIPANRLGYGYFTVSELRGIQEIVALSVFLLFSVFYMKEPFQWHHAVGFAFIAIGALFIFHKV